MKKFSFKSILFFPAVIVMVFLFTAFEMDNDITANPGPEESFEIPEDIQSIFDNSCFGCHNAESQSEKGKKKLMIDKMHELSTAKLIAALEDITDVVDEGEMPPEKFLAKYPEKALTDEEVEKIKVWVDKTADDLLK